MEEEIKPVEKKEHYTKKYVTQEQFSELLSAVQGLAKQRETKKEPIIDEAAPAGSVENPNLSIPMNPEWRKVIDDVLGKDFGMTVEYSKDGSLIIFGIIVPDNKSNMKPDYKEFFKTDIRKIALNPAQTGVGVRQWCERIKRNLGRSAVEQNNQ